MNELLFYPLIITIGFIVFYLMRCAKRGAGILSYSIGIILLLVFIVPIHLTLKQTGVHYGLDLEKASQLGGFLSGIFGTLLLVATILFQIRAFRKQQVETKFFELVKYYRDNVSEMRLRNPFFYDDNGRKPEEEYVVGRRVLKTIFEQYKVARKICHKVLEMNVKDEDDEAKEFEVKYEKNNFHECKDSQGKQLEFRSDEWKKRIILNEIAYHIMFWGIPLDVEEELKGYIDDLIKGYDSIINQLGLKKDNENIYGIIKSIVAVWESDNESELSSKLKSKNDIEIKAIIDKNSSGKVKFFGGHQYHLGHYFRHLYHAVKYIDSQPTFLMSDKEKKDYIKTLRAQMSNYEQALLFINSLTKLGRNWEYDNKEEKFITKYNLIKNLPQNFIPYMRPQYYYPEVDFEWKQKKQQL